MVLTSIREPQGASFSRKTRKMAQQIKQHMKVIDYYKFILFFIKETEVSEE